uniref:C2H2-type domain-containing protein n=1 Tax=Anopheles maculatus TaxID=74869 RepID=A0A182SUU2_9DIPT
MEESEQQEAQIDVYHVDGQLQHIVMEGGTFIEVKTEEPPRPPVNQQTNLLNGSLSKTARYSSARKRPTNAQLPAVSAKKPLPTKLPTVPTPSRMLNTEASSTKRPTAQFVGQQHKPSVAGVPAKQLYRCNQCLNLFVELSNYYSHTCQKRQIEGSLQKNSSPRQSAVSGDGQRIQCKLCNMSYRSMLQYQKHEYEAHGIRNENFGIECTICNKQFSQRQDYQLHMRAIHPMQGVSFVKIH